MAISSSRRSNAKMVATVLAFVILCIGTTYASSPPKGMRLPWQTTSTPTQTQSSSSLSSPPRGGGAALRRKVQKGSDAPSLPVNKGTMKKKMKKGVKKMRKVSNVSRLPDGTIRSNPGVPAVKGDTMPSIFRIPSEEKYDRYAAALAVTEGLRRVRDAEIARTEESQGKKSWLGSISSSREEKVKGKSSPKDALEAAKKRSESAFLLQSTKAVKALGMTVTQFNQIGREVLSDPALKERVSEQAYLYRMASAVNLEKVPLLDDPSSKKLLQSQEHKKFRVQLFARSIHEIEDLRSDQLRELRQSLQVERFPPGFDLSDPNVQPLLHPEVRRVCEKFPVQAEEIVKRYGLDSDEFNRMLEETKGNPIFRWRVQKYVEKAEEEKVKENKA